MTNGDADHPLASRTITPLAELTACSSFVVRPSSFVLCPTRSDEMNAEELRALQAPLKEKYRDAPDTALVTLRAEGRVGEVIACSLRTGVGFVEAGLHPATGGDGFA